MIEMPEAFHTGSDELPFAEPPGSTHTLKVADHNKGDTDVVFILYGTLPIGGAMRYRAVPGELTSVVH